MVVATVLRIAFDLVKADVVTSGTQRAVSIVGEPVGSVVMAPKEDVVNVASSPIALAVDVKSCKEAIKDPPIIVPFAV